MHASSMNRNLASQNNEKSNMEGKLERDGGTLTVCHSSGNPVRFAHVAHCSNVLLKAMDA